MEKNYYEDANNVEQYSQFTPAEDGGVLVEALHAWLPEGSTALELGIGPGKDFKLLSQLYEATGSDFSNAFLQRYRAMDASADLLQLDARTLDTERHFDAIYSNKVLIHLSAEELQQSFARQHEVLNDNGLILHSFWYGEGTQEFGELTMVRHNESALQALLEGSFKILAIEKHAKMAEGDSIYVVARKK